jgi:hypothetical protein
MSGPELGGNRDTHDEATVDPGVTTTDGNAIDVLPANASRMKVFISATERDGFVRLIDAATDTAVRKGIFVPNGGTVVIEGAMYIGPISVMNAKDQLHPTFYVTEY